ncbi:MAG: glycosyl hydrolase [Solirubrobacteraceae bacterium]
MANYSPSQVVYAGDLSRFRAKWWLGGYTLSDRDNQSAMLRRGYHFLPSFNAGYVMRANGLTSVPATTTKRADSHSCIDTACGLNNSAILSEVEGVQRSLGSSGNYYSIGNEVDDYFSDDVSPGVYVGQFDAWVNAIKHGDPSAKIVAPNIDSFSCCTETATSPFGTAGQWFQAFVTDYKQMHSGTKPPIDVLSMHLYNYGTNTGQVSTTQADKYLSDVQKLRREANSLGYAGTPIWITEMGFRYSSGRLLSSTQSSQVTCVLRALAARASALDLQRVFLYTNGERAAINDGLRPLYDPGAKSGPSKSMALTDYGRLVKKLAHNTR